MQVKREDVKRERQSLSVTFHVFTFHAINSREKQKRRGYLLAATGSSSPLAW
jgi:hypothetical protein